MYVVKVLHIINKTLFINKKLALTITTITTLLFVITIKNKNEQLEYLIFKFESCILYMENNL